MRTKRELLSAYLVDGKSVRDIAWTWDYGQSHVRALLAQVGISVPPDKIRDEVCEVIAHQGFGSFAGYTQQCGLKTLTEQANELGVTTNGLKRIYSLLAKLAEQEEPGLSRRDSQATQGHQG
jgi:hypothetical protein